MRGVLLALGLLVAAAACGARDAEPRPLPWTGENYPVEENYRKPSVEEVMLYDAMWAGDEDWPSYAPPLILWDAGLVPLCVNPGGLPVCGYHRFGYALSEKM